MAEIKTPETQVPNTEQEKQIEKSPEKEQNPLNASQERLQKELQVLDNELQDLKGGIDLLLGDNGMEAASTHSPLAERMKTNMTARISELKTQIDALLPEYNTISEQIEQARLGNVDNALADGLSEDVQNDWQGEVKPEELQSFVSESKTTFDGGAEQQESTESKSIQIEAKMREILKEMGNKTVGEKEHTELFLELKKQAKEFVLEELQKNEIATSNEISDKLEKITGSELMSLGEDDVREYRAKQISSPEGQKDSIRVMTKQIDAMNEIRQQQREHSKTQIPDSRDFPEESKAWRAHSKELNAQANALQDDFEAIAKKWIESDNTPNNKENRAFVEKMVKDKLISDSSLRELSSRPSVEEKTPETSPAPEVAPETNIPESESGVSAESEISVEDEFEKNIQESEAVLGREITEAEKDSLRKGVNNKRMTKELIKSNPSISSEDIRKAILNSDRDDLYKGLSVVDIGLLRQKMAEENPALYPLETAITPTAEEATEIARLEKMYDRALVPEEKTEVRQQLKAKEIIKTMIAENPSVSDQDLSDKLLDLAVDNGVYAYDAVSIKKIRSGFSKEQPGDSAEKTQSAPEVVEEISSTSVPESIPVEPIAEAPPEVAPETPAVPAEEEPSVVLDALFAAEVAKANSPDVGKEIPEKNKETLKNLPAQDKDKKTVPTVASRARSSSYSTSRSGYSGGGSSSAKAEKGKPEEGFFKKGFKKVKDFFKGLFGIK